MQTINLLNPHEKKNVYRLYRLRRAAVALFLSAAALFAGSMALLPSLFVGTAQERDARERLLIAEQSVSDEELRAARLRERDVNARIGLLRIQPPPPSFSRALQDALSVQPNAVSVTSITYEEAQGADKAPERRIVFEGIAESRSTLLSFARSLETLPFVERVDVPVSQLAESADLDFTVSVSYAAADASE